MALAPTSRQRPRREAEPAPPAGDDPVSLAVNALVERVSQVRRPRVGLILGTGLGGISAELTGVERVPYRSIPQFPRSTALSHAGEWLFGEWATGDGPATPVAVMSGRFHLYEGYCFEEVTRPIQVMAALGVKTLIITNAAGGLASGLRVGDLVVIRDHINFTSRFPCGAPGDSDSEAEPCPLARRGGEIYDAALQEQLLRIAEEAGIRARSGVYIGVTGPNYETRAEYRFFRQIGDLVGMSTVPEALAAVRCGMRVAALSTVTNVCDPDDLATTSGDEVAAAARGAEDRIRTLLREFFRSSV